MPQSFMAQDIRGILIAFVLFAPYLFLPGYAAGFLSNIFGFRTLNIGTRAALSVALSLAILPVFANLLARFLSLHTCAVLLLVFSLAGCAACLVAERATRPHAETGRGAKDWSKTTKTVLAILGAGWASLGVVSFMDLQIGHRLWTSVLVYDDGVRSAFVHAVLRSGVPPSNPLCFFGTPVPSRYYYYWSTVCALPAALGHLSARSVLAASSIWDGLALAATIGLFLRFFLRVRVRLERFSLLGIGLIAVTGLDLIPTAISWFYQGFVRADMEWWDGTEIPSWVDSLLWTPHHVAGMLCCLIGFLLLWPVVPSLAPSQQVAYPCDDMRAGHLSRRQAASHICIAGIAFASAAGLSVYMAFCFGLFVAAWILRLLLQKRFHAVAPFALASVIALLLSVPLLLDLRAPASGQLDMRTHRPAHLITTGLRTSGWVKAHFPPPNHWRVPLLLVDISATYILEFGFYLVVLFIVAPHLWRRRRRLSEAHAALCYLLGTALFVTTFLRSEAIRSNDLGMRAPMFMEWVLLLWAIPLLHAFVVGRHAAISRSTRWVLRGTLLLGIAGSAYQLVLLRIAEPLSDWASTRIHSSWIAALPVATSGRDTYLIREAESSIEHSAAPRAVAAYNPSNPDRLLLLFYTHMQIAAATPNDCGTPFGGSISDCRHTEKILDSIFAVGEPPVSPGTLNAACTAASVNLLLVQSSDPVWHIPGSWVWTRPALAANPAIRAVRCGSNVVP